MFTRMTHKLRTLVVCVAGLLAFACSNNETTTSNVVTDAQPGDGGVTSGDGGVTTGDAGVAPEDGGTTAADAGQDGGTGPDAG
jgi:hypothetical protein